MRGLCLVDGCELFLLQPERHQLKSALSTEAYEVDYGKYRHDRACTNLRTPTEPCLQGLLQNRH